jgi:tetratricopeptide (TPR) repeat protein
MLAIAFLVFGRAPNSLADQPLENETARHRYNGLVLQGSQCVERGDFVAAVPPLKAALGLAVSDVYRTEPNHKDVASLQHLLGEAQALSLEYTHARATLKEASLRWRKNYQQQGMQAELGSGFVNCLVSEARLLRELGADGEAVRCCEEAKQVLENVKLGQSIRMAELLFEFGQIRFKQHNRTAAEDYLRQSLTILEGAGAPPEQIRLIKRVLAGVYIESHWHDDRDVLGKAQDLLSQIEVDQERAVASATNPRQRETAAYLFAELLVTKATLPIARKNYAEANAILAEAEKTFRLIDSKRLPGAVRGLTNCLAIKAQVEFVVNPRSGAERTLEQALKLRSLGNTDVDVTWESNVRLNLGMFYYVLEQREACKRELTMALDKRDNAMTSMFPFLNDRQRLVFLTEQRVALDVWLSFATSLGVSDDDMWARIVSWKGRTIACHPAERYARMKPEMRPLVEHYQQACQSLAYLRMSSLRQDKLRVQRVEDAEREVRNLEDELERNSRVSMKDQMDHSIDISGKLPEGVTLIDYVQYAHFSMDPSQPEGFDVEQRILAFVARHGVKPVCVRLPGTSKELAIHIHRWRRLLESPELPDYPPDLTKESEHIAEIMWRPLAPFLGDPRHVIICPDGPLVHFAFAALPGKQNRTYLVDDVDISYSVSGRQVYQMFTANPEMNPVLRRDALVIAGVHYKSANLKNGPTDLSATLPFGVALKSLFEKAHAGESAHLLSGDDATRARFVDKMHSAYRMISCMIHGKCPATRMVKAHGPLGFRRIERASLASILDTQLIFAAESKDKSGSGVSFLTGSEFAVLGVDSDLLAFWSCGLADGEETDGEGAASFMAVPFLGASR